jgi:hypothetical protein
MIGYLNLSTTSRDIDLLRLLLRLEFVTMQHLHTLIYPDYSRRMAAYAVKSLYDHRLIWRRQVSASRVPGVLGRGNVAPQAAPYLYGLTRQGFEVVADVEDCDEALHRAVLRDWKEPEVKLPQLAHDLWQ